jgi:sugar/nucleoside kinase (ribokinase family)
MPLTPLPIPHPPTPPDIVALGSVVLDIIGSVDRNSIRRLPSGDPDMANVLGRKLSALGPIRFFIGGGAANVGRNFTMLGLQAAVLSRIADDEFGQLILNKLIASKIDCSLLQVHAIPPDAPEDYPLTTGVSEVFSLQGLDRTILTWKGAADDLRLDGVDWDRLGLARGFYISNFTSHQHPDFLEQVVSFARSNNQIIAFNPGKGQIAQGLEALGPVLQQIDILSVNLGEALDLSGLATSSTLEQRLQALKAAGPKVVLITDGKNGTTAYDGQTRYFSPPFKTEVKSTLGAGDAYGSTFMAYYLQNPQDIPSALLRAAATAASVVSHVGAQAGLLTPEALEQWIAAQPGIQVTQSALAKAF